VYSLAAVNPLVEMSMGARAAAQDSVNVSLSLAAPPGVIPDPSAQVTLFQTAIKSSRDGVAFQTNVPDAFVAPLQQARSSGVPLIAVDAPPPPSTGVSTFIGNSNFEIGQQLIGDLLNQIPAGATGQVVIGTPLPGFPVLDQRITGMLQLLKQERPGVQVVGPFDSKVAPPDNLAAWAAQIEKYPNALAYLGSTDNDAVSIAAFERQSGRRLLVGAADIEDDALRAVKEGLVHTLVSPEHWLKGYLAVRLLAEHAQSGRALPDGWWNPGTLVVDAANVDEIIARQRDNGSRAEWFASRVGKQLANPAQYVKPLSAAT